MIMAYNKQNTNPNVPNLSFKREQSETCFDSAERVINQKQNVPNLRFPEFSEDWVQTTIGEIGNIKNGPFGSVLHAEDYVSNGVPIVTTEHFKFGTLPTISEGIPQVSDEDYIRLKGYVLNENDIVFSRVGSVDINALVGKKQSGWLFSGRVLRVRPMVKINPLCLHYVLSTESVKKDIRNRAVGQTMPSINTPILSKTALKIPNNIIEQNKIASLLSLLDNRIATQNKIIEDLKKLKVAIIENAFCGKHYNYKIGDIITQISNRNKSNKETNVLSVSNKLGFVEQSEQFEDRTVASEDVTNYKIVRTNDFVYNPARINVGSIARLKQYESGIVSPMYICFHAKKNVLPEYLEMFFLTQYFKHEMYKRLEGSVRLCLSFEGLTNIPISIPEIPLQKEISEKILAFETKIGIEEHYLNALEKQKQYLLQQMFI